MQLIRAQQIAFTATVSENEIRQRVALEVLEQIGGLDGNGRPMPGIKWKVRRGSGRQGGYRIDITGPAPARAADYTLALTDAARGVAVALPHHGQNGQDGGDAP